MFRLRHLIFMPSVHLVITFLPAYCMYVGKLIRYEESIPLLHVVTILTILLGVLASFSFYLPYRNIINSSSHLKHLHDYQPKNGNSKFLIAGFLVIGILGILKYTKDYSNFLGSSGLFFLLFFEDSGQVRSLAENVSSIGIQLSYFTWIAAFLIAANIGNSSIKKSGWFLILLIILANIVFVDRTRPIWIFFTCILTFFFNRYHKIKTSSIIKTAGILIASVFALFIVIGLWLGKITQEEDYTNNLPPILQPPVLYATASFAYLNRLLVNDQPVDYLPLRLSYPLQKVLASAKLVDEPPNQILDFYYLPAPNNVGTFLEPYYNDGGMLFIGIGILIQTFFFNLLGLFFLKYPTRYSLIALATLCFCNFIGFFTPKITNLPTWIFIGMGVVSVFWVRAGTKNKSG